MSQLDLSCNDANYTIPAWRADVGMGRESQSYIDWVVSEYHADHLSVPPAIVRLWQSQPGTGLDIEGRARVHQDDRDEFSLSRWEDQVVAGQTLLGYEPWLAQQAARQLLACVRQVPAVEFAYRQAA